MGLWHWDYVLISVSSSEDGELIRQALEPHHIDPERLFLLPEGWGDSGAGNGFGTLYLIQQAAQALQHKRNLLDDVSKGASVLIIHAAGMGKRLYPLPLCTQGCKSLIPVPSLVPCGISSNGREPLISAIYRSSLTLVDKNRGRFQVLWGDQLVLSTPQDKFQSPLAIFVEPASQVSSDSWELQGWHHYGIVGIDTQPRIFEKLSSNEYESISLFRNGFYKNIGAFSLSLDLFQALAAEFQHELRHKVGHADSDHDFWMPLTLLNTQYEYLLQSPYTQRMHNILHKAPNALSIAPCKDLFFDFGRVRCFFDTLQELLAPTLRGAALRSFFHLELRSDNTIILSSYLQHDVTTTNSIVIDSQVTSGQIHNSIVIDCKIPHLDCQNSLLVSLYQPTFSGKQHKVYVGYKNQIIQDLIDNHPKKDWAMRIEGNHASYAQLTSTKSS